MGVKPAMNDNKRGSVRVPCDSGQVIVHGLGPEPLPAAVLDESFGGMGVAVPVASRIGAEIDLEHHGVRAGAIVRHMTPLPSGCRLGIEWKAQALSRRLRELMQAAPAEDEQDGSLQNLSHILPGGMCMLWKLFEARKWEQLAASTDRLRREAAACQVRLLSASLERLQDCLQEPATTNASPAEVVARVEDALNRLIGNCIELVQSPASQPRA